MPGNYLLDSSVAIPILRGEKGLDGRLRAANSVCVAAVVIGELLVGARKSASIATSVAQVEAFAARTTVVNVDIETARRYADIKDDLRRRGRPIPENDIWIAAIALQHDLILVSRDAHFTEVSGLATERW